MNIDRYGCPVLLLYLIKNGMLLWKYSPWLKNIFIRLQHNSNEKERAEMRTVKIRYTKEKRETIEKIKKH